MMLPFVVKIMKHDIDCVKCSFLNTEVCGVCSYDFALRGDGV